MFTRLAIPAPKINIHSEGGLNGHTSFDDCDGEADKLVEVPELAEGSWVEVLAPPVDSSVPVAPEGVGVVAGGMVDWLGIATVLNKGSDVEIETVASGPIYCSRQSTSKPIDLRTQKEMPEMKTEDSQSQAH
ncbi:hypothetical protein FOPE_12618 [Fonsecaea pedrosoi]|nr:hypothetical protein FOPE_12618 [Fonsecaea pedrosoi]